MFFLFIYFFEIVKGEDMQNIVKTFAIYDTRRTLFVDFAFADDEP